MNTVRKSLAQIDSFWVMIRHDGLNQIMVLAYLALCVIFLNMKLSSSLPADQQISWLLTLLPEGMLVVVLVLHLVQKVLDPLFWWLFPWPQIGRGKTNIMKVSWVSRAFLIFGYRPTYLLLCLNPLNSYFWKINESNYLRHKRLAAKKQAK